MARRRSLPLGLAVLVGLIVIGRAREARAQFICANFFPTATGTYADQLTVTVTGVTTPTTIDTNPDQADADADADGTGDACDEPDDAGGCCSTSTPRHPARSLALAVLALAVVRRRRRR